MIEVPLGHGDETFAAGGLTVGGGIVLSTAWGSVTCDIHIDSPSFCSLALPALMKIPIAKRQNAKLQIRVNCEI